MSEAQAPVERSGPMEPPGPVERRGPAEPQGPADRLGLLDRLLLVGLLGGLRIIRRLPDGPLYRLAYAAGIGLSLVMRGRRSRVHRNLVRVCEWLVASGQASPRVARAASSPRAMDGLVRAAFGHWTVSYMEAALGPRYGANELRRRFIPADPEASAAALAARAPGEVGVIHMAMHFGSVDLSALYGARVGSLPVTGPMEEVASPLARAYFDRVRSELGVTIVPLRDAAPALVAALQRGEAVGIVADRNVLGSGSLVELFGAPARLPLGPAVLSVQTGAPIYLQAIERTGLGRWLGHSVLIRPAPGADRRTAIRSILDGEARAFERIIARAPEQWTTLSFPIWTEGDEE